ncbi:hypothetical protein Tco_0318981 [Tanacetum coccineum]
MQSCYGKSLLGSDIFLNKASLKNHRRKVTLFASFLMERFSKVIIYYRQAIDNIHRRSCFCVSSTGDDFILGNLKFVLKVSQSVVFGIELPILLIMKALQQSHVTKRPTNHYTSQNIKQVLSTMQLQARSDDLDLELAKKMSLKSFKQREKRKVMIAGHGTKLLCCFRKNESETEALLPNGDKDQDEVDTSTDKVDLEEFDLKSALFKHMNKINCRKVKDHKRKHDSDDDEDDDDDEGPSAGSNQMLVLDSSYHRSDPESEHSEQSSDDIPMQDEGHVSDMEDTENAHIPKTKEEEACQSDLEGPAFNLVKAFHKNSVFLQYSDG